MGNPFVHMELSTDDVDTAKKFYKKVFDWKLNQLGPDMGNYIMIDTGSKTSAGGMTKKMMPTQPTGWLVYAEVASVKKTMAKASKAGAKVMVPFMQVGSQGALGIFVDPTGAGFGVWERSKKAPARKAAKKSTKKKR